MTKAPGMPEPAFALQRDLSVLTSILRDFRHSLRQLAQKPLFTMAAVLTVGLGIGATTVIFSVLHAVLLQPLPYERPERLVMLYEDHSARGSVEQEWLTPPAFFDYREESRSLQGLAAWYGWGTILSDRDEPELLTGAWVSHDYFRVLGARPLLGRWFLQEEEVGDGARVVVLAHELWQRSFGGDPGIVGQTVQLTGNPYEVVGVAAPGLRMPLMQSPIGAPEIFRPLPRNLVDDCGRGCYILRGIGRLADGATIEGANAEARAIFARWEQEYPQTNIGKSGTVVTLREQVVGPVRPAIIALTAAVGFVLLIACANVANLLLARATEREREVAIRTALGAGTGRIVRQLLTESTVLALAGGILGIVIASWGIDALVAMSPPALTAMRDIGLDSTVLAFSLGLSLAVGIIFGLVPALRAARTDLTHPLKEGGRGGGSGTGARRWRQGLVVAQVATALLLLAGAGLMMRSFLELQREDIGVEPRGVLSALVALPAAAYPDAEQRRAFFGQLLERLDANPAIQSAAATTSLPLSGNITDLNFQVEGRPAPRPGEEVATGFSVVTPGYFATVGMRLLRGRDITRDDHSDAPPVMVVSESFASSFFPGEDPIGRRITFGDPGAGGVWRTIVGVTADVRHMNVASEHGPHVYLPLATENRSAITIVLRTAGDPASLAPLLRREVRQLDASIPLARVMTLESLVARSVALPRLYLTIFMIFAGIAIILAAVGIYGVIAYSVAQRTHEIGIRMALGAAERDVLGMVLRQGGLLAAIGIVIGLVLAFATSGLLRQLVYGVSATDPLTLAIVAVALGFVALLASYLPARRAARTDPLEALRAD